VIGTRFVSAHDDGKLGALSNDFGSISIETISSYQQGVLRGSTGHIGDFIEKRGSNVPGQGVRHFASFCPMSLLAQNLIEGLCWQVSIAYFGCRVEQPFTM